MKTKLTLIACLFAAVAAQAADSPPKTAITPQVNALFRVLKADGATAVGQATVSAGGAATTTITVNQADALAAANGRCAFNVKLDEVSNVAVKSSSNRLYSNDTLVAQNTGIELQAGVLRTVWTQPYLFAGVNNVKVVLNADAASPSTGWVRINVVGNCNAAVVTPPKAEPKPAPAPAPAPAVTPASAQWNALYTAWGYSNYGVTQLKGKGYARYNDLVRVNADLTTVVNAKRVEQAAYNELMARWNTIANDPAFKALMAAVVPATGRK